MILSVDLGTSKICAAAVDIERGDPLVIRSCTNDADIRGLPDDMHEQEPVRIRDLCFDLIRQVLGEERVAGRPIEAIGISGQMHGVLLVDRKLRPLTNLITWRDRRTAREDVPGGISESLRLLGTDREPVTGCRISTGYGAATLRWLDRNGLLPPNCTALSVAGFLAASLCGVPAVDETHAASWGILDLVRSDWDEESITRLDLPRDVLPEIRSSARPLAQITDEAAGLLGIKGRPLVCSPVGDVQASVIGAAGFAGDTLVVNIGTGAQVSIPRQDPVYTEELDVWPMPLGGFLQVGATYCGGWSYAYLKSFFQSVARDICGTELTDEEVYERMNELAGSARAGASGLTVDTRFSGARKDKSITGSIMGIDTANFTPANLCLAFIEGLVRDLYGMWAGSGSRNLRKLVASGNAVRKNPVLIEAIRRIFDLECSISNQPEEAVRGAAYAAAACLSL